MKKFLDYSPKSLLEKVGILFVFMSIMHIMHKKGECQSISHPRSLSHTPFHKGTSTMRRGCSLCG